MSCVEQACATFVLIFLLAMRIFPILGWFYFGDMPRYLMPATPFLALMVSRLFTCWEERGVSVLAAAWMGGLLLGGGLLYSWNGSVFLLEAAAAWASVALLAGLGKPKWAAALLAGGCLALAPLLLPATDMSLQNPRRQFQPIVQWFLRNPSSRGRLVLTNFHLLPVWAERIGLFSGAEVRYMVQADQIDEIQALSNPHIGQQQGILKLMERHFYGRPVFPEALRPELIVEGSLFVLSDNPRLSLIMPAERWETSLETLAAGPGWRIAAFRRPGVFIKAAP
jgi:hypothetical protein